MSMFGWIRRGISVVAGTGKESKVIQLSDRGVSKKTADSIVEAMKAQGVEALLDSKEIPSDRGGEPRQVYLISAEFGNEEDASYWKGYLSGFTLRLRGIRDPERREDLGDDDLNRSYENGIKDGKTRCEETVDLESLASRRQNSGHRDHRGGNRDNRNEDRGGYRQDRSGGRDHRGSSDSWHGEAKSPRRKQKWGDGGKRRRDDDGY